MIFNLSLAMQPRMLVTFDEKLQPLPVTVRVGQVRKITTKLMIIRDLKYFIFMYKRPSMLLVKRVSQRLLPVFRHIQHLFYWLLVSVLSWLQRNILRWRQSLRDLSFLRRIRITWRKINFKEYTRRFLENAYRSKKHDIFVK